VESEEYAEWQSDALNDRPGIKPKKAQLHWRVLHFLDFKGVDDPHGEVADEQESDDLSTGFGGVVAAGVDPSSLGVGDEEQLQHNLDDGDGATGENQQVLEVGV